MFTLKITGEGLCNIDSIQINGCSNPDIHAENVTIGKMEISEAEKVDSPKQEINPESVFPEMATI